MQLITSLLRHRVFESTKLKQFNSVAGKLFLIKIRKLCQDNRRFYFLNSRNDITEVVVKDEGPARFDDKAAVFPLPGEMAEADVEASSHDHACVLVSAGEATLRADVSSEVDQRDLSEAVADESRRDFVDLVELEVQGAQEGVVDEQVIADWRQIVGFQVQSPEVDERVESGGRQVVELISDEPDVSQVCETLEGIFSDFIDVIVEGAEVLKPRLTSQRVALDCRDVVAV